MKSTLSYESNREIGIVTQVAKMLREQDPDRPLNRRQWRAEAKDYIHDPIRYEKRRLERLEEEKEAESKRFSLMTTFRNLFKKEKK